MDLSQLANRYQPIMDLTLEPEVLPDVFVPMQGVRFLHICARQATRETLEPQIIATSHDLGIWRGSFFGFGKWDLGYFSKI